MANKIMNANDIREKYLEFFKSKNHSIIESASVIPENDPTVLFTTAGMHPLIPFLMGEKHPAGKMVTGIQKCIRTSDIEEVGDTTHHTFFEMLGNWSFGDYFKEEAIEWSYEFLTSKKYLGLDKSRIAVSVFVGDDDSPFDSEAYEVWKKLGIPEKRIAKLGKKENWWGPAGKTGPCGPDTEMFYWVGDPEKTPESFNDDDDLWVEIWNDVFMQYNKTKDGKLVPLSQQNVDTGMGLERILSIINNLDDNYKTELFTNIVKKIEELSGKKYNDDKKTDKAIRIIADHIKAATFIIGDTKGVAPSNTDQGYIVRRLIRRAIRHGKQINITKDLWVKEVAEIVIKDYKKVYPELEKNYKFILSEINKEEEKFSKTLEKGLKEFENLKSKINNNTIEGKMAFDLYQTYGFPIEIIKELAGESGIQVDEKGFECELKKHQDLSRTASAGKFKGGLADSGEEAIKLHTATHLLNTALKKVLGDHVSQKGSNITEKRLRFDFTHNEKLTDDEKIKVEEMINDIIKKDLPISFDEMSLSDAKKIGAIGIFDSKYEDSVKVYKIGKDRDLFSIEICGGPHVASTGELGEFKIKKEQSSSSGVRRIKGVLK